jgi:hypothetical protein
VWSEGWEDMHVLCQHIEESLHNETRSEIRLFIACSKNMIISSRTAESTYLLFKFLLHTHRLAYTVINPKTLNPKPYPLLLSRKNSENLVLCLALVAIVSHGAAVSMLQVFYPFASSSLMSNAKPKARSGVVFSPLSPAHPPACMVGSFISGLVRMNQSSRVGIVGFVCL